MGNRSKFSSGQRQQEQQQQQLDVYRIPSSSINQPTTSSSSSSRRESRHQLMFDSQFVAPERPPPLPPPLDGSSCPSADTCNQYERENPTKITHGFWLQQYSWLHKDNSLGSGGVGCASGSGSGTVAGDTEGKQRASNANFLPSRPQNAAMAATPTSRRRRLLTRWNNLVRTFGGSQGDNLVAPSLVVPGDGDGGDFDEHRPAITATSSAPSTATSTLAKSSESRQRARGQQEQQQQHDVGSHRQFKWASPSRWRPASSAATTATAHPEAYGGHGLRATPDSGRHKAKGKSQSSSCDRKRGRSWFMKSLSNSASTLMSPVTQAPPSLPLATTTEASHQIQDTKENQATCRLELPGSREGENRSKSSCELRTLEGLGNVEVGRSSAQPQTSKHLASPYRQIVRALANKSPTRRRQKKKQQQQQLDEFNEFPAAPSDRPKRSRIMQFALAASGGGQQQQQQVTAAAKRGKVTPDTDVGHGDAPSSRHQPSLLGSLFVSPLFRRRETTNSKSQDSRGKHQRSGQNLDPSKLIGGDKEQAASSHGCATGSLFKVGGSKIREENKKTGQEEQEDLQGDLGALEEDGGNVLLAENGHHPFQVGAPRGAPSGSSPQTTSEYEGAKRMLLMTMGGRSEVDQEEEQQQPMQVCLPSLSNGKHEREDARKFSCQMDEQLGEPFEGSKLVAVEFAGTGASSEFKFQLERRNYYANETKVATKTATLDSAKCLDNNNLGHDDSEQLAGTDCSKPSQAVDRREVCEMEPEENFDGRRDAREVPEVAQTKKVKVIHDAERETKRTLDSNGFGDELARSRQYERLEQRTDEIFGEINVELKDFTRQDIEQDNNNNSQPTIITGNQMRASKTEEAIVAGNGSDRDDNDDDDDYGGRRLDERSLLPLIQPLASSSSSFSSICFDSTSQHAHDNVSDNEQQQQQHAIPTTKPTEPPERPASTPVTRKRSAAANPSGRTANLMNDPTTSGGGNRQKVGHAPSSSGVGMLKNNFKKLVKRQQSVDSYRMARDLKNKQKRQHEVRNKHQSNEAIKTKSVGDERHSDLAQGGGSRRNFSMLMNPGGRSGEKGTKVANANYNNDDGDGDELVGGSGSGVKLRICIDPYAKPGSFTLPGEDRLVQDLTACEPKHQQQSNSNKESKTTISNNNKLGPINPTPPNTLSLMPQQPGSFIVGTFSGCITPTYPTHHLPSPKYGPPPASKKYSNASTISSSFGGESHATNYSLSHAATSPAGQHFQQQQQQQHLHHHHQLGNRSSHQQAAAGGGGATSGGTATNQSDTESSLGGGLAGSPSRQTLAGKDRGASVSGGGGGGVGGAGSLAVNQSCEFAGGNASSQQSSRASCSGGVESEQALAAAAARRAQLAEHIYDNKCGLGEDMKFLASLPELCDITFLVGETREPVCAVKSVLAARSRVFHKILFGNRTNRRIARQQRQEDENSLHHQQSQLAGSTATEMDRRSSSPKQPNSASSPSHKSAMAVKSSSPAMGGTRNTSPNQQQQQQQWSVMADASGYNNPTGQSVSPVQSITGGGGGGDDQQHLGRSGRVSVTSNGGGGRDSGISHTSQGSQQPLIIGPGQMAAPAPPSMSSKGRNKKSSTRGDSGSGGSRLSRMFMKRASDPSIKQQHHQLHKQQSNSNQTTQSYLDKMSSSQMSTTMIIEEFEPDVFRQLIEYIHTGCVLLQARTLLGLLNAADYYGLEQLRKACLRFVSCCITVDTVCSLLSTAERYIQYKCTKSIVQKVLEFVDNHADEIFKLNAFGLLPEHVVRLILARDGLQADEHVKYNGVYTWCEHYCRSYELTNISDVMRNFIDLIQFHRIPTNVLLGEIYPTHIVPDNIFLSALAYQADPQNFEPQPMQTRRMTLPNPTIYSKQTHDADLDDNDGELEAGGESNAQMEHDESMLLLGSHEIIRKQSGGLSGSDSRDKRKSATELQESKEARGGSDFYGPQQQQQQQQQIIKPAKGAVRSRKSTGGQPDSAVGGGKASKLRKGSIAQVSISGVMRLSHKLSIKKRPSNIAATTGQQQQSTAQSRRRIGSYASSSNVLPASSGKRSAVSKQQSAIDGGRDPMHVGQQILTAYLEQQRQRELELQERKRQEELERLAVEEAKRRSEQGLPGEPVGTTGSAALPDSLLEQHDKQPIVKSSSTRKSFKDFRHISRRIFMRHSSSKMLQQQHSSASSTTTNTTPVAMANVTSQVASQQQQQQTGDNKDKDKDKVGGGAGKAGKRRNMLKIKRSETVFETTATT